MIEKVLDKIAVINQCRCDLEIRVNSVETVQELVELEKRGSEIIRLEDELLQFIRENRAVVDDDEEIIEEL